jgi:hypothetical protein
MWNFGSLLAACLGTQIVTGVLLAMHYAPTTDLAFVSVEHIMRDVNFGWLIRYTHANVASFFFIFVYGHIGRNLYYGSYKSPRVLPWSIGVIMLVLMMGIAFLGYVLPYGQMSLWGVSSIGGLYVSYRAFSNTGRKHPPQLVPILFGSLLGDCTAELRSGSARFRFYQSSGHASYLLWLHALIAGMGACSPTVPVLQSRTPSLPGGTPRDVIRFSTYSFSDLLWLYTAFYPAGLKVVPRELCDLYLTPEALAIWIMDDGSNLPYGLKLATNSFTAEDNAFLAGFLSKRYSLDARVHSAGVPGQTCIYITSGSMPALRKLVTPHMHPSMLYKL